MQYNSMTEDENYNSVPNQQSNQDIIGYDPMTGEPIMGTMKSLKDYKRKVKMAPIIVAVATVLIVIGIAVSLIKSGVFLDASGKVVLATLNTMNDSPRMMKAIDYSGILNGKNPTVEIEGVYAENKVNVTYAMLPEGFDISAKITSSDGKEINLNSEVNDTQLLVQVPEISENTYTYSYTAEKKGYIKDILGEEYLNEIDGTLDSLYKSTQEQTGKSSEAKEKLMKTLEEEYSSLRFLKAEEEKFWVDGKERKCKGYKTTLSYFNLLNIMDAIKVYMEELYGGMGESWENYVKEYDETRGYLREMPDMDMTCYIYKNKLACIELKIGVDKLQLKFQGGKTRMQNIELSLDNISIFKMAGEVEGSKEKFNFSVTEAGDILGVQYDSKSGDYKIEVKNGIDTVYITGNLMKKRNTITMTIDKISGPKVGDINGNITMKIYEGDSSRVEFSGDKIDIGNMSEKDFEGFGEDIGKYIEELDLGSLF